jgi:hypothetical protein
MNKLPTIGWFKLGVIRLHRYSLFLVSLMTLTVIVNGQVGQSVQPNIKEDRTKTSKLISQGDNNISTGELGVLTYRLEEIKPTEIIKIEEKQLPVTGFQLIITTSQKLVGNNYRIWIDDNSYEAFGLGSHKVGIVIYSSGLPNGAQLALSTIEAKDGKYVPGKLSVLSERLSVPSPYDNSFIYATLNSNAIRLTRKKGRKYSDGRVIDADGVEIEIPFGIPLSTRRAERWMAQIGEHESPVSLCFNPMRGNNVVCVWVTDETFNKLKDGANIKIKYGEGILVNGTKVGVLNKNSIHLSK